MQQSKNRKQIIYGMIQVFRKIKSIYQDYNYFVNKGSLEGVKEALLVGMRDFQVYRK